MHRRGLAPSLGVAAWPWPGHLQGGGPAAQGRVVRHREIKTKQAHEGADQPFGLPERQTEHGPERQGRKDGELRVPGLAASGGARLSPPGRDRFVSEPDRQAATLAQASVVGRPVRDLALLSWNMMTTVLVELEGHDGHPGQERGALLRHPAPQHQPTDPCTTLAAATVSTPPIPKAPPNQRRSPPITSSFHGARNYDGW